MTEQTPIKRCAIYSRSSVEKDNRDSFDSVSAQFMACAEFIGSQVGKGWRLVDTIYEDRGYSGSHLRRAGFRALLNDIKLGLVDAVVVHRLDRLTRNLSDFQQIMTELNAHDVPVVSVTQQIDMSHHVGRLATNIITSFAEFEREMVGQRVKEKRAATLESGRWQGTSCPLGYVVEGDRLVVDQAELKIVQEIFTRYASKESVTAILNDLNARGMKTKSWRIRTGKLKGGKAFNRNAIYTLLKNRVYLGEVFYAEFWQEGAHDSIINDELWGKVAALLEARSRRGESRPSSDEGSIFMLRGRVFGADGRAMSPWLSSAYKGRKYAYYIPQKEIAEGAGASGLPRLQAANLNEQVWSSLRQLLSTPEQLLVHLPKPLTESPEFDLSLVVKD
ncbi:MAG: recombinase family protein [Oceanicoccus sp.]|uniref:recombinase family protein n=1 Tax=Oceanicoccus sp. TaxID=2691044 RepID=UPI00262A0DDE|nr:recombinase family protein [Oceanicoccus sp.]MCP3908137.1 recombinase family protein [Oceanicoccus sp.]